MLLGVAAYVMWGLFPLYWPLLQPAGAVEILGHRMLWSAVTMGLVLLVLRRRQRLLAVLRDGRVLLLLVVAAATISVNWAMFIWAVNNGRVVETSLGYFINPLVSVAMGVLVLRERLRRLQWLALGLAAVAVVLLTVEYGHPPWVALTLAFSFGTYGLVKKLANAGAIEGLTLECLLVAPLALGYLVWLERQGQAVFGHEGAWHALLFVTTGVVTAVPLLCFGAAATRVPLVTIGLLQYLAPILHFLLGVLWFREEMPAARWAGFALVWLALALFTAEALTHRRRQLAVSLEGTPAH